MHNTHTILKIIHFLITKLATNLTKITLNSFYFLMQESKLMVQIPIILMS